MTERMNFIVTGASSGIGRATVAELADRGHRVVAVARRVDELVELATQHSGVMALAADVTETAGVSEIVAACSRWGQMDGLVHGAASLIEAAGYREMDAAHLSEHFRVHVAAPIALNQALTATLPLRRIVYLDSYSATTLRRGWEAYSIMKAAAQMAARAAAAWGESLVIRAFPGAVQTPVLDVVLDSAGPAALDYRAMLERGEVAQPADTARFVSDLLEAPEALVASRDSWDYNSAEDRAALAGFRT